MVCLNDNLLNAPVSPEIANFFDNSVTFSLLNIRSILGKLPDLETDCNINNASIMCFCETWLTPTQESPQLRGHIVLRCDRTIENNHGGILMSVPQYMNPRNVFKFNRPGIEILLATLSFSDKCTMQMVLLYRSPQIPMQHLLTVLISVFNTLDFSLPSIVLGDFNEDFSPLALNEPDTT